MNTERLRLRLATRDDLDLVVELNADVEVMRHITGRPMTVEESTAELDAALGARWLVFARHGSEFVGWVAGVPLATSTSDADQEYDVGWRLRRSAWGNGFASEAATALIDHLFAEGATRVVADTMAVNHRSRAVMERIGMRHARTFHLAFDEPLPGTELGEVEYSMTRADWLKQAEG